VAFGVHALDDTDELRSGVDLTLVDVVATDEESSLSVVGLEDVEDVSGVVLLWAIVVGQSNCARGNTVVDTSATVLNGTDLSTGNGRGVGTSGGNVLRAAGTVLVVATRRVAVIRIGTAVCFLSASRRCGLMVVDHTSGARATLSSGTRSNTSTALTVVLTGSQAILVSMSGLDLSNASLEVGKQVTGLQVAHVDTSDLGETHSAMSAD
jgi:hypothetical protein